ncbi:MAG TPA: hypothetical protein VFO66_07025 [Gemmatimonadaceae bacterium]|nr:hypothetical protein [Gemmatimonadaceae bacterium]
MRPSRSVLFLAVLSCSAPAPKAFVAPSPATIIPERDIVSQGGPRHVIAVRNASSVPITVTGVLLSECVNLRNTCGLKRLQIAVPPGQRRTILEVQPARDAERFTYRWTFQWRDSSGTAALEAMAGAGDSEASARLAAMRRADSVRKSETGIGYQMLSPSAIAQIAPLVRSIRLMPESLRIRPGGRVELERINVLLADSTGEVLGRTRMVRFSTQPSAPYDFVPPGTIVGRRIGEGVMRFRLAESVEQQLGRELPPLPLRIRVGYDLDPRAPTFLGLAVDEESMKPLGCVRVVLEDSAANEVASDRSVRNGTFLLKPPIPGTYRVLVTTPGWMPVASPLVFAAPDEEKQTEYRVRFVDQTLSGPELPDADRHRARIISVRSEAVGGPPDRRGISTPIIRGISLGGSANVPILGIIAGNTELSTFAQFIVDSTGRADTASVLLPAATNPAVRPRVVTALSRVRFAPAMERGRPVCEMMRLQVNVLPW